MILKAYKYRLFPTADQREFLAQTFGSCRFVYNWALATKKDTYETEKKSISRFELDKQLTQMKNDILWLKDTNAQALQQSLASLDKAYNKFFKEHSGYPRFKSKYDRQSFSCPQNCSVDCDNSILNIPKIKGIPIVLSRKFEGKIKTVTVSKTKTDKYFVSILVETAGELPKLSEPSIDSALGIDVGLKDFATLSDGTKIPNPKKYRSSLKRLKKLQRSLSHKKKGSSNRAKARKKLALLHEKISNQRSDFLHKATHTICCKNHEQTICVEDLSVKNMLKNHYLAMSISDAGWGEFFRQLKYKCSWYGKNLLTIGRFEPSSKTCSNCGWVKTDLSLKDREWTCSCCNNNLDRDINAARNIKQFAFVVPVGQPESEACGELIRVP